jgi:hypothetical protein
VTVHAKPAVRLGPFVFVVRGISSAGDRLLNSTIWLSAITAGIAFLVYLSTLAVDLTLSNHGGDGGELITASFTLGVAHPPGYPIYIVLGKVFSMLPVGTIAFRYNLLSAVFMALAAGLVTAIVIRSSPRAIFARDIPSPFVAVAAGLTVAFTPLVWSQAVVTEVYALNLAFLAAFLLALTLKGEKAHFLAGVLLGLSCASHATSLLLIPLALVAIPGNAWPSLAAGFLLGLAPLLLLPFLGKSESPLIWGRPDTLAGWWWLVTASIYQQNIFGLAPFAWFPRLRQWAPVIASNIVLLVVLLIFLRTRQSGRVTPAIYNSKLNGVQPFTTYRIQLALFLTALLYVVFAISYSGLDAEVLLLPAVLVLGVLLGLRTTRLGIGGVGLVALLLPIGLLLFNLQSQNLHQEASVRVEAERLLQTVPREALLLTPGDQSFAALSYFLHVEGQRTDLSLVDANLFQFDWYRQRLSKTIPSLHDWYKDDLRTFIGQTVQSRPVCVVSLLSTEENYCLNQSS